MPTPAALKMLNRIRVAVDEMPTISPAFNKLTEMARNLETDATELVKLIMLDPVLAAKVIKMVNSAYYGLNNPVNSLAQAVIVLGLNTVKNLAMCTAALDKLIFDKENAPMDPQGFWSHCLATAVGCRMLAMAQEVPANELEMHFLAGLLHDLGKIPLIKAVPDVYRVVLAKSMDGQIPLCEIERDGFSFDHAQVGRLLATRWKMDPLLIEAIEAHHAPERMAAVGAMTRRVIVINNLCKKTKIGQSGNGVVEAMAEDAARLLEVDSTLLDRISGQLPSELEKALKFLKVME
jgi:putative nucleotidyltransferase with HDIG domain